MKKEPVPGGKADKDPTEDKQGRPRVGQGQQEVSGRGKCGGYSVLSTLISPRHNNFLSFGFTVFLEPSVS